jgi:hypothetical protein
MSYWIWRSQQRFAPQSLLLADKAEALCGAKKRERSPDRTEYLAGVYSRTFYSKAVEMELKYPRCDELTGEKIKTFEDAS